MNAQQLDAALINLVRKRIELSALSYDNDQYDTLEEELHGLEDAFVDKYGTYLEGILEAVHEKHCPETDVLLPTAYLAKKYTENGLNSDGTPAFAVTPDEGVWVDADAYPGKEARLVLVPSPARLLLLVGAKHEEEVWRA